jgi:hypothetical protein
VQIVSDQNDTQKQDQQRPKGRFIYPYIYDAADLVAEKYGSEQVLKYYHLPIVDLNCTGDDKVFELAYHIAKLLACQEPEGHFGRSINKGNGALLPKIYIHCWGGHGRTGTLVAVILGLLYNISNAEALDWTQCFHDIRKCKLKVNSPQTKEQCDQVCRILLSDKAQEAKKEFGLRVLQGPQGSVFEKSISFASEKHPDEETKIDQPPSQAEYDYAVVQQQEQLVEESKVGQQVEDEEGKEEEEEEEEEEKTEANQDDVQASPEEKSEELPLPTATTSTHHNTIKSPTKNSIKIHHP